MGAYGATPAEQRMDRDLVVTWAGPEAVDVLFFGSDPIERASLHEAGHCVAAWKFGHGIAGVQVRRDGSGVATFGPMGMSTSTLQALRVHNRDETIAGDAPVMRPLSDARRSVAVSRMLRADRKAARELLRVRRFEARLFVNRYALLIRAVAAELLRSGKLTGLQVESIIYAARNKAAGTEGGFRYLSLCGRRA
jgi:hypothetical protein